MISFFIRKCIFNNIYNKLYEIESRTLDKESENYVQKSRRSRQMRIKFLFQMEGVMTVFPLAFSPLKLLCAL